MGDGCVQERPLGPGHLCPRAIFTSDVAGAGCREVCPSFLASELERPQSGRKERGDKRQREAVRGCVCVSECVCVYECRARGVGGGGGAGRGGSPNRGSLSPGPVQACFLPKLLMSSQLQKPGDL